MHRSSLLCPACKSEYHRIGWTALVNHARAKSLRCVRHTRRLDQLGRCRGGIVVGAIRGRPCSLHPESSEGKSKCGRGCKMKICPSDEWRSSCVWRAASLNRKSQRTGSAIPSKQTARELSHLRSWRSHLAEAEIICLRPTGGVDFVHLGRKLGPLRVFHGPVLMFPL